MRTPTPEEVALGHRVQECMNAQIRPLLHIHGGDVEIARIEDGEVTLRFHGACRGCHYKSWTILAVIETRLLTVEGVSEVNVEGSPLSRHARERTRAVLSRPAPRKSPSTHAAGA